MQPLENDHSRGSISQRTVRLYLTSSVSNSMKWVRNSRHNVPDIFSNHPKTSGMKKTHPSTYTPKIPQNASIYFHHHAQSRSK